MLVTFNTIKISLDKYDILGDTSIEVIIYDFSKRFHYYKHRIKVAENWWNKIKSIFIVKTIITKMIKVLKCPPGIALSDRFNFSYSNTEERER